MSAAILCMCIPTSRKTFVGAGLPKMSLPGAGPRQVSLQGLKRELALNSQNSRNFSNVERQWCGWKEISGEEFSVYTTTNRFKYYKFQQIMSLML